MPTIENLFETENNWYSSCSASVNPIVTIGQCKLSGEKRVDRAWFQRLWWLRGNSYLRNLLEDSCCRDPCNVNRLAWQIKLYVPALSQKLADSSHKNQACYVWSGCTVICLVYVPNLFADKYRSICSICDHLSFYFHFQINLRTVCRCKPNAVYILKIEQPKHPKKSGINCFGSNLITY